MSGTAGNWKTVHVVIMHGIPCGRGPILYCFGFETNFTPPITNAGKGLSKALNIIFHRNYIPENYYELCNFSQVSIAEQCGP